MTGPLRSADKAYYASKQPLLFRGTREGRKNPAPNPSYKQKANDVTASSNKYYASIEPVPQSTQPAAGQKVQTTSQPEKLSALQAKVKILPDVVAAFQQGATSVRIEGESADINKARAAVEMAVGRKTLTREQSDRVVFVSVQKPATAEKAEVRSTEQPASTPEADAILNPPAEAVKEPNEDDLLSYKMDETKKAGKKSTRKSTKKKVENPVEDDSITEADIASAFGVVDDSADFDDDSDD